MPSPVFSVIVSHLTFGKQSSFFKLHPKSLLCLNSALFREWRMIEESPRSSIPDKGGNLVVGFPFTLHRVFIIMNIGALISESFVSRGSTRARFSGIAGSRIELYVEQRGICKEAQQTPLGGFVEKFARSRKRLPDCGWQEEKIVHAETC